MVIVLLPPLENQTLAKELCALLEEFGGVIYVAEDSTVEISDFNPEFLLLNMKTPRVLQGNNVLYLNFSNFQIENRDYFQPTRIISTYPSKTKAKSIITIGSNAQCTLCISSNNEHTLYIALQDTITTLDGTKMYPCEIEIRHINTYSTTTLLLFSAILLLCGKVDTDTLKIEIK